MTERIGYWVDLEQRLRHLLATSTSRACGGSSQQFYERGLLYRATRSCPTARAAPRRSPATRWAGLQGRRRTRASSSASRSRRGAGARARRRVLPGLDDHAVDAALQRGRWRCTPTSTTCASTEGGRRRAAAAGSPRRGSSALARQAGRPSVVEQRVHGRGARRAAATGACSTGTAAGDAGPARPSPWSRGAFVTTDDGTGIVHMAPAFGEDDYDVGPRERPAHARTPWTPRAASSRRGSAPWSPGSSSRTPTRRSSTTCSRSSGGSSSARRYVHTYPHCWRCDTPLLYYARDSWYVRTTRLQGPACSRSTRRSHWIPPTSARAASASGSRTTSTGRSRATATGARRCRSGLRQGLRHASRRSAATRARASRGRAPLPDGPRPTGPSSTRSRGLRRAAVRGTMRRTPEVDRRLVRLGRDAVRAVALPVRERGARASATSRPTSSPRPSTRRAAGSTRCSP